MMDKDSHPKAEEDTVEAYEPNDVPIGGILRFGGSLTIGTAGVLMLIWWLFGHFESREMEKARAVLPATRIAGEKPQGPPAPILQGAPGSAYELTDPLVEMLELRRTEDELLKSSSWVDRNAGVVRIPIEHAKKLLLKRGLPSRRDSGLSNHRRAASEAGMSQPESR